MKNLFKKSVSLFVAFVLMMSLCSVAFAADSEGVLMKSYSPVSKEDFHQEEYKGRIGRVIFLDLNESDFPSNVTYNGEFDISANPEDGQIIAKIAISGETTGTNNMDLYIGAKGGIIAPADCSYLFADTGVQYIIGAENFDTSSVTSMKSMFKNCSFVDFDFDILDTSSVTDFSYMFKDCTMLKSIKAKTTDTSNVKNFRNMFDGCTSLVNFDVENFNLRSSDSIDYMFYGCTSLTEIDLGSWKETKSIESIDAFKKCPQLRTVKLNGWDLSGIKTLDGVFAYCTGLQEIYVYDVVDAVNCKSSSSDPMAGVVGVTVYTENIDFTETSLWKELFFKAADVKVNYSVYSGNDIVSVFLGDDEAVDYYIVTVDGDDKIIYGGSTINFAQGETITVGVKTAEGKNVVNLNVNGESVAVSSTISISGDTDIAVQTYYNDEPIVPDENEVKFNMALQALKAFMDKIIEVLEGFFGRFLTWFDR